MIFPKCFAPAVTQSVASLLMLERIMDVNVDLCLKTLAFRSHQIVQQVSMVRDAITFWLLVFFSDILIHQSLVERSSIQ